MTTQLWRTEFPDFTDMPALPESFVDTSWHNNTCPSMTSDLLGLQIWIDYTDEALREFRGGVRYLVERQKDGIETGEDLLKTNNWGDVLRLIEKERAR